MKSNLAKAAAIATIIAAIYTVGSYYKTGDESRSVSQREILIDATQSAEIAQPNVAPNNPAPISKEVKGKWFGRVTDKGRSYYDVEMIIEHLDSGEYSGKTVYSGGLNCSGLNTFETAKASVYVFKEVINQGRGCANQGRIEVYLIDGFLKWEWFRPGSGGDPEAIATLSRRE